MQYIYIYSCSTQVNGLYGKNEKLTRCRKKCHWYCIYLLGKNKFVTKVLFWDLI